MVRDTRGIVRGEIPVAVRDQDRTEMEANRQPIRQRLMQAFSEERKDTQKMGSRAGQLSGRHLDGRQGMEVAQVSWRITALGLSRFPRQTYLVAFAA